MLEEEEKSERTAGADAIPRQEPGPEQEIFITLVTARCQSGACLGAAARGGVRPSGGHWPPEDWTPSAGRHIPAMYLQQLPMYSVAAVIPMLLFQRIFCFFCASD